ncbi:quaternary amine ABC transporter ATP-binding protein [Cohaesibacter gelatinilyticus]|uniref:Quaternary amine transport ATP-binding protein n=1 Tax=Cohaesibacter gelatinilyticus TaxID=372072 RepID=A0A285PFP6_9HYPH|nr:glycine betaine/L-proline ABC transporter ATP-binding protein [Cohaesibacter gelatinilyticus]SNZ20524.1 glycine betaine/proline transport system ATP-binding protein [Cohaesibacter gelatinilyticus]HAT86526.1 glycine betaine/L-proline ABC transporter ATP-binding protein [Hyphomicrobiales bacterium]
MSEQDNATLIEVKGLYKLFGSEANKHMHLVHEGLSKDEILAKTGHTLGLKDINLKINRGEISVIMGLSGSGKSTLIRHFNRLIDPTEGNILVDGTDVMTLDQNQLEQFRRHKMSMVFQRFGLLPHRTVLDNAAYGLTVQGLSKKEANERAVEWLETVGLGGYEKQYPSQLSGGQQQRVGLARALATNAEILLMDEAFSALDPLIRSEMQDQLIELQEKLHKTIIFITHDLDEALHLGNRIAILKDGELVQDDKPEEILLNPATDYVEAFVRDVNRARALTVETVMQPQICRITADSISDALKQMRKTDDDYGYHVTDDGYQGIVSQETLEEAVRDDNGDDALCEKVYEDIPIVAPDAVLEDILPETINADYPVPVVDEEGEIQGELSREAIADVLSPDQVPEEAAKASQPTAT